VATLLLVFNMQQQVTDLVLKFLRQGFTIEQIQKALEVELETIRKVAPMLKAQKEAALAP
jgi:acyl CoA:acetate/3-ketoacid CoA transferase beta subunit